MEQISEDGRAADDQDQRAVLTADRRTASAAPHG
jgi:hypothetical protein